MDNSVDVISIDQGKCIGCGKCVPDCPASMLSMKDGKAVADGPRCIECGHCIAICPVEAPNLKGYDMSQVLPVKDLPWNITPEDYMNHIRTRRSIRKFTGEKVSKDALDKMLYVGRYSPTASNMQDVSYFICQDDLKHFTDMILETLLKKGKSMMDEGATGLRAWYAQKWIYMYDEYYKNNNDLLFFGADTVMVISSGSPSQSLIAGAHIETLLYTMGLGMIYNGFTSSAIGFNPELAKYVGLKEGYQPYAVLAIGHPDVEYVRTVPRKEIDVIWK